MKNVPLGLIADKACQLAGCSEADLRLGWDEKSLTALGAFGWLADRCSAQPVAQVALWAGRSLGTLLTHRDEFAAEVSTAPVIAANMDLEALATIADAERRRRRDRLTDDVAPEVTALRLINHGPAALTVGSAELRALAAAYLALLQDITPETTHV